MYEVRRRTLSKITQKNISDPADFYDLINPFVVDCCLESLIEPRLTKNYSDELGSAAEW